MTNDPEGFEPIREYDDTWSLGHAEVEGKPLITRYREGLKAAIGHSSYKYQIGIAIPLLEPSKEGLPTQEEGDRLYEIEDALTESLTADDESVFALSITTGGMRELVFYAGEWKPEYYEDKVRAVATNFPEHELQYMIQSDPEWETFSSYSK
ncbi:MAG: DUF695 domain-containing protein [Candidatus Pacebacteria bacterium]|nr:DUF695 domain-containing protein [Candidatus Paceibacterota bacterium]